MARTGLESRINSISKATGGGKVTVELPRAGNDDFYARVYPTTERVRQELLTSGGEYTLPQITREIEQGVERQIEYGAGRSVEDAVAALWEKVKPAKKRASA